MNRGEDIDLSQYGLNKSDSLLELVRLVKLSDWDDAIELMHCTIRVAHSGGQCDGAKSMGKTTLETLDKFAAERRAQGFAKQAAGKPEGNA
jgi:hypothetical protein